MGLWFIPMVYIGVSVMCGLMLPRIEQAYLASYTLNLSVASAQAYLSASASGMMALTGIVFAMAFVMVQFSAIAYSARLVLLFARDRTLFHSLGAFAATFMYALFTLVWIDRGASGSVPLFSNMIVGVMLIVSMLLFALLVQRLTNLQITNVLRLIGDHGRRIIGEMFHRLDDKPTGAGSYSPGPNMLGPVSQTLKYSGEPRTIAKLDMEALVKQAQRVEGVIAMRFAVGDTLIDDTLLLQIHGAHGQVPEQALLEAISLGRERTFEQDAQYPLRLLVDVAIKALSPAINDPTTAVQTIDQIEDLLRRLGRCDLDAGYATDAHGAIRLVFPVPTWEDYMMLAFDEIRGYGATSVQVMRRLRSALLGVAESLTCADRVEAVKRHLTHLDATIEQSFPDFRDKSIAHQEDRRGLGLAHSSAASPAPTRSESKVLMVAPTM